MHSTGPNGALLNIVAHICVRITGFNVLLVLLLSENDSKKHSANGILRSSSLVSILSLINLNSANEQNFTNSEADRLFLPALDSDFVFDVK
jgi:hypothetical protein